MSRIEDLIKAQCPDGVQFKALGDCVLRNRGGGTPSRSRAEYWDGAIQWASVGDITASNLTLTRTRQKITEVGLAASSSNLIPAGHVVVAVKIAPGAMRVVERDLAINQDLRGLLLSDEVDPYFLTYYFKTINLVGNGTIVKGITNSALEKIRIPVPPLEVQRQIVETLNRFTQLQSELHAELAARHRQYEHYRSELLNDATKGVAWSPLGDVAGVRVGQAPPKGVAADTGPFAFVNAGTNESGRATESNTPGGTVTIPSRGQGGVGVVGYRMDPFWCGPLCYRVISSVDGLSTRFLYYYLKSVQASIRGLQQTGGTPALNRKELVLVQVPMPPMKVQDRIVSILDGFDSLLNDHNSGLPAEIAARSRQYAHYLNRLLTFEEVAA